MNVACLLSICCLLINVMAFGEPSSGEPSRQTQEIYDDNGNLESELHYVQKQGKKIKEGKQIYYKDNGTLLKIEYFSNGKKNGPCYLFLGSSTVMRYYVDGNLCGPSVEWNQHGEIVRVESNIEGKTNMVLTSHDGKQYGLTTWDKEKCKPISGTYIMGEFRMRIDEGTITNIFDLVSKKEVTEDTMMKIWGSRKDEKETPSYKPNTFGVDCFKIKDNEAIDASSIK